MENLSFGLSVDHVLAVTVSGLLGAVWKFVGPEVGVCIGSSGLPGAFRGGCVAWKESMIKKTQNSWRI